VDEFWIHEMPVLGELRGWRQRQGGSGTVGEEEIKATEGPDDTEDITDTEDAEDSSSQENWLGRPQSLQKNNAEVQ
jgi:hypothetical protein